MLDPISVSDPDVSGRLAVSVARDMELAGLDSFREIPGNGVRVFVDYSRVASGEVFVEWYPSEDLQQLRMQCALNGDFQNPALGFMISIHEAMTSAICTILESAGYGVDGGDIGVHESALKVTLGKRGQ